MFSADDIKKIRRELNLKQRELATMLGVSVGTIQNYEKGGVIPESKRELLMNLSSGNISIKGDGNISNTGIIDGNMSISANANEISKLKQRIKELEKENKELMSQLHEMSLMNGKLALEISRISRKGK